MIANGFLWRTIAAIFVAAAQNHSAAGQSAHGFPTRGWEEHLGRHPLHWKIYPEVSLVEPQRVIICVLQPDGTRYADCRLMKDVIDRIGIDRCIEWDCP